MANQKGGIPLDMGNQNNIKRIAKQKKNDKEKQSTPMLSQKEGDYRPELV